MKILLAIAFMLCMIPQTSAQEEAYKDINNEVWSHFYSAFSELNYKDMAKIHSKDLWRVTGNSKRIRDYESYISNYKQNFERTKKAGMTNHIALRFFERIVTGDRASERGIYELIVNKGKRDEQRYYGQFHVLHQKEDGAWKILMDYDSNEGNSINATSFQNAKAIDDFSGFVQN